MSKVVLSCRNLGKRFTQGELDVSVLDAVNLSISEGDRVAIMGTSGSGKSTLLHLLGGLDRPTTGEVELLGQRLADLREREISRLRNEALGFIYQFHHLLGEFTLLENVAIPLLIGNVSVEEAESRACALLEQVGLKSRIKHKPGELSGGERQRAAIARALVTKPRCVLADEPTGNLDRKTADAVYELMLELNQAYEVSFLVVTHDPKLAARMDKQWYLEDGTLRLN
ncbi:MAG: lipoprotein-releasing transporter ATP-binding protein LolD [Pseudomonadota bacterium]|jgi:lipoprotein-releasing system ATP-binding protein